MSFAESVCALILSFPASELEEISSYSLQYFIALQTKADVTM